MFAHTSLQRQLWCCTSLPERHILSFPPEASPACVAWCCFPSFLLLPTAMAGSGTCVLFQWSAAVDFLHHCFPTLVSSGAGFVFAHCAPSVKFTKGKGALWSAECLEWCRANCGCPIHTNWRPDWTPDGGSLIWFLSGLFNYNSHPLGFRSHFIATFFWSRCEECAGTALDDEPH